MDEIPNNRPGMYKTLVNNGINYQPQLVQDFVHQQYHHEYEVVLEVWHKQHSFKLVISEESASSIYSDSNHKSLCASLVLFSMFVSRWEDTPRIPCLSFTTKSDQLIYHLKHTAKASSKCLLRAVGHRNTYLPQVQNFRSVREKKAAHMSHDMPKKRDKNDTPESKRLEPDLPLEITLFRF